MNYQEAKERPKRKGAKYDKKCPVCQARKAAFFWKDEYYMTHCLSCYSYGPECYIEFMKTPICFTEEDRGEKVV